MIEGFKNFLMKGNVVDLAIAVVIGGAFGKIIEALVAGIITPLIGALIGQPKVDFAIGPLNIGLVVTAAINFVAVSAVIYFMIVVPMQASKKPEAPAAPAGPTPDQALLAEIRDLLRK